MTEPAAERRRKVSGKGAALGLGYAACFVAAVVASVAVIYTGNEAWMRFGFVAALWAALGWAFIADQSRRKAELVSAKASDYKLIYDLQLEREIAARHHYELSLENELRRQLTAETESATQNILVELQQQVAVLRGQLQELLDQDLEYDQPALKARATRLDELLVARQSLGGHEPQPRKRAADASPEEAVPPRLWLPSQPDQQQRREPAQQQHEQPVPLIAQEPQPEPAPEPVAEQWQPVAWQQQQPHESAWEGAPAQEQEEPQASWQQLGTPPANGGEPVASGSHAFDYPSWYSQPAGDQAAETRSGPSDEYPSWYAKPDEEPSPVAELKPEPEPVVHEPAPVAEPAPEPVAQESAPAPELQPEPVAQEPQKEASSGKGDKSRHAGKASSRVKHGDSRGGRRARPVEEEEAAARVGGHAPAAEADALAGAHASGHSVGELLSRLNPEEAAGYHGRRRRTRTPGGPSDQEA